LLRAIAKGYGFLIDGFSYMAVIASLLAMKVPPAHARGVSRPLASEIGDGCRYVKEPAPIRSVLLFVHDGGPN
jgi:hypothetical protein